MDKIISTFDNKVRVNYLNVSKNIQQLRKYNSEKKIIAVVKNDAYNLGIKEVVKECLNSKVHMFAVTNITEALLIDSLNLKVQVLILNPLNRSEFILANKKGFHVLIYSFDSLLEYNENMEYIKALSGNLENMEGIKFHIKINVGMNRFGIKEENIEGVVNYLKKNSNFSNKVVGLMTHFPQADEECLIIHNSQVEIFTKLYNELVKHFDFEFIHSENSAAFLLKHSELYFCNYARIGILLYGYSPIKSKIKLYPTMVLKNKIVQIHNLIKGENLGYGTFKVNKNIKVGICPTGYGDGIISERKSYPVYINNNFYNILTMSMSHIYIEIDCNVNVGDEVELYGYNIKFDDIKNITNSKMMCSLKRI